jgi:hypothetical protein
MQMQKQQACLPPGPTKHYQFPFLYRQERKSASGGQTVQRLHRGWLHQHQPRVRCIKLSR